MKKIIAITLALVLIVASAACVASENTVNTVSTAGTANTISSTVSVVYEEDDTDAGGNDPVTADITLNGDSIAIDGSGATVDGSTVTITSAGTYRISGTLNDGRIVVDTADEETVRLVLDGAKITCSTSAPIYVAGAEKTVITLADGTVNSVTDGSSYIFEDAESDEPNAAIFSKDDLTINGGGSLTVNANYNDGITSRTTSRSPAATSPKRRQRRDQGRDSVAVRDGAITVTVGGDGIQSNNDEDAEKGYIVIEGGTIDIVAGADGIQAETSLSISGGTITTLGRRQRQRQQCRQYAGQLGAGHRRCYEDTSASAKGLKAGIAITITGGKVTIDRRRCDPHKRQHNDRRRDHCHNLRRRRHPLGYHPDDQRWRDADHEVL
jgi:hypothetical protein